MFLYYKSVNKLFTGSVTSYTGKEQLSDNRPREINITAHVRLSSSSDLQTIASVVTGFAKGTRRIKAKKGRETVSEASWAV